MLKRTVLLFLSLTLIVSFTAADSRTKIFLQKYPDNFRKSAECLNYFNDELKDPIYQALTKYFAVVGAGHELEDKTILSVLKTYSPSPFIFFNIDISKIADKSNLKEWIKNKIYEIFSNIIYANEGLNSDRITFDPIIMRISDLTAKILTDDIKKTSASQKDLESEYDLLISEIYSYYGQIQGIIKLKECLSFLSSVSREVIDKIISRDGYLFNEIRKKYPTVVISRNMNTKAVALKHPYVFALYELPHIFGADSQSLALLKSQSAFKKATAIFGSLSEDVISSPNFILSDANAVIYLSGLKEYNNGLDYFIQALSTKNIIKAFTLNIVGRLNDYQETTNILMNEKKHLIDEIEYWESNIGSQKNFFPSSQIAFVIDSSGSMSHNDPSLLRVKAVELLLDQINETNSVSLIDFDDDATLLSTMKKADIFGKNQIKTALSNIDSMGSTDIPQGLKLAIESFNYDESEFSQKIVILFTDGKTSNEEKIPNLMNQYLDKGITIYTIGLSSEVNANLLKDIANRTNGFYQYALNAESLRDYFNNILSEIEGEATVFEISDIIRPSKTLEIPLYLDSFIKDIKIILTWKGSKIGLSLLDPTGRKIGLNDGVIENYNQGENYIWLKIKNPIGGNWKAILKAIDIPADGEKWSLKATGKTELAPRFINELNEYPIGSKINIEVLPSLAGNDIQSSSIKGYIVDALGNMHNLSFYNDKTILAQNKTFYADYGDTQYSGNYRLRFKIDGTTISGEKFSRILDKTLVVGRDNISSWSGFIKSGSGSYFNITLGKTYGLRRGLKVKILAAENRQVIAEGYITDISDNYSTIEIQKTFGLIIPKPGCPIELDKVQWMDDNN